MPCTAARETICSKPEMAREESSRMGIMAMIRCGGPADDNLIGGAGDNGLDGGAGKNFLFGGPGNDWILVGADPEIIDGGSGTDTVVFIGSNQGVNVDLGVALKPVPGLGGYAQGDLISGVENVIGSA